MNTLVEEEIGWENWWVRFGKRTHRRGAFSRSGGCGNYISEENEPISRISKQQRQAGRSPHNSDLEGVISDVEDDGGAPRCVGQLFDAQLMVGDGFDFFGGLGAGEVDGLTMQC